MATSGSLEARARVTALMEELALAFGVGADGAVVALRAVRAEERFVAGAAAPPRRQRELGGASAAFWRSARAAPATGRAGEATRWYSECETLRSVRHGLDPNLAVTWLEDGRSCATALRAMAAGDEATRDWMAPHSAASVSRAALALELLPAKRWADSRAHAALATALAAATGGERAPLPVPAPVPAPAPAPAPAEAAAREVLIYTDYAALLRHHRPRVGSRVRLTTSSTREPLDGVWLATPITAAGWAQMPLGLMVNQFPREGALVRKDLLAGTARAIAASSAGSVGSGGSGAAAGAASSLPPPAFVPLFPPWCLVTFDLATEAHEFLAHAQAAEALEASAEHSRGDDAPRWIVKLAAGTHSSDPCITSSRAAVARYAASAPGGDRVVQAYEQTPLLLAGHKFDVRVYVAVRSFAPLDAAVHSGYYARVAAAPLPVAAPSSGGAAGVDLDAHLTVSWYAPGADSGAASRIIDSAALTAAAAREGVDWPAQVHPALVAALAQLFQGAGALRIGGGCPDSRALYGIDVLPAWRPGASPGVARRLQPLVLECNFQGDLETLLERVPAAGGDANETFVDDALAFLFAGAPVPSGWEPLPAQTAPG